MKKAVKNIDVFPISLSLCSLLVLFLFYQMNIHIFSFSSFELSFFMLISSYFTSSFEWNNFGVAFFVRKLIELIAIWLIYSIWECVLWKILWKSIQTRLNTILDMNYHTLWEDCMGRDERNERERRQFILQTKNQ